MLFPDVIKNCEAAGGAGSKKIIAQFLSELDQTGRQLMFYLYDPYKTFGVKKYDEPVCHAKDRKNFDQAVASLFKTMDLLHTRQLTGNAARQAVTDAMELFTAEDAKYMIRVINKDPKAGFSADTFNKVWPDEKVPVFALMLADKCTEVEDFEKYITFPCWGDIKYDGERNLCIVQGDSVLYLSRSGLEAEHMRGLFDEELLRIREHLGYDFVMDGERMAASYIETINAKKSGLEGEEGKKSMRFRAFFFMSLENWNAQSCRSTMKQNREDLIKILAACKCFKITPTKGREVKDYHDMMAFVEEVTSPGYDDMPKGQEGLILKEYEAEYEWDRMMTWCKVKKFYPADARIISYELGRKGTKLEHTIGRLNIAGWTEDGTYFECGVGSGLKEKKPKDEPNTPTRDEILANWDKFAGSTVEVKYQELSKGKNKVYMSLRFPTVFRFRDDKIVPLLGDTE